MEETETIIYHHFILKLMKDFQGTIISGGTTAGIPGLVGQVKAEIQRDSTVDFELIAYLPESLPRNATRSSAYDHFYVTDSGHFSILEILTYWSDLVVSGIKPSDVVLIGIDGGDIASMEYRIALSLGAKVAVVADSGRAVADILSDKHWNNHPNLVKLTGDPFSLRELLSKPGGIK
jgi:hypothetical protein